MAVLLGMWCFQAAWLAVLIYHLLVLLVTGKPARPSLDWQSISPIGWGAVAVAAAAGPAILILWPWMASTGMELNDRLEFFQMDGWVLWFFIPYFSLVHPVLEERLWRSLDPDPWQLFSLKDLAFAGYHGLVVCWFVQPIWVVLSVGSLTVASMFWRWVTWKSGSRTTALVSHAAADAAIIIAIALRSQQF